MSVHVGYPDEDGSTDLVRRQLARHPLRDLEPVLEPDEVLAAQQAVREVYVDEGVLRYAVALVTATRSAPEVALGASPRASVVARPGGAGARARRGPRPRAPRRREGAGRPRSLAHRLVAGTARGGAGHARGGAPASLDEVPVPLAHRPAGVRPRAAPQARRRAPARRGRPVPDRHQRPGRDACSSWRALLLGALVAGLILPFAALRGLSGDDRGAGRGRTGRGQRRRAAAREPCPRRPVVGRRGRRAPRAGDGVPARRRARAGDAEVTTLRIPATRGERSRPGSRSARRRRSASPNGAAGSPSTRRRSCCRAVFPLGPLPFVEAVATHDVGIRSAPRLGHGPDFLGVREYRPGDAMRHVHWGLTARHGQIMVREFEEERTRRLAIVVDTERDEGDGVDAAGSVPARSRPRSLDAALAQGHGARAGRRASSGRTEVLSRERGGRDASRWLARLRSDRRTRSGRRAAGAARRTRSAAWARCSWRSPTWPGTDLAAARRRGRGGRSRAWSLVPVLGADDPTCPPLDGVERPCRGATGEDLAPCRSPPGGRS